jgi:hypothetical protein
MRGRHFDEWDLGWSILGIKNQTVDSAIDDVLVKFPARTEPANELLHCRFRVDGVFDKFELLVVVGCVHFCSLRPSRGRQKMIASL